ncbi:hypothetical protein RND81_09G168600 [Saponaria officinalis]|uniref:Uncharacterized protein n=1 Tax=Saponaria officinalis TaxID=3572 RepID=A0AAW1INP1_SAPOF
MWGSVHIRRIVRVSQMVIRWRKKASSCRKIKCVPSDVPPGHVAVIVGESRRRFVVRAKFLNHPLFRNLLSKAEDECGFDNNDGPIFIPCDESAFEDVLRVVTRSSESVPRRCRTTESLPLIRSEKPLC